MSETPEAAPVADETPVADEAAFAVEVANEPTPVEAETVAETGINPDLVINVPTAEVTASAADLDADDPANAETAQAEVPVEVPGPESHAYVPPAEPGEPEGAYVP